MNNFYIDTHCHLQDEKFNEINIDKIIKNAKNSNVKIIIISGYDEQSNIKAIEIAEKHDNVYATVGYQPLELEHINDIYLDKLKKIVKHPKVVAIGEIGLDCHYDNTNIELQKEYFIKQLKLANNLNMPIVIHTRDCIDKTYEILKEYKNKEIKGVIHCYSGSYEMALKFEKLNLFFGIGGVITYKNNTKLNEVLKKININKIVLETDAPYLSVEPKRKEINEPSNINLIGKKLAELKEVEELEIMNRTTKNAKTLFDIK